MKVSAGGFFIDPADRPYICKFDTEVSDFLCEREGFERSTLMFSMLNAASVACGSSISVSLGSKMLWANMFSAIVGDTGSGKSRPLEWSFRPLQKINQNLAEKYETELEQYEIELQKCKAANEPLPKKPLVRRVLVSDVTKEQMANLLKDNPKGICVYVDELAGMMKGMGQYKGGRGDDKEFYLSAYDRRHILVDRVTRPAISCPAPHLSVIGTIQPSVLKSIVNQNGGQNVDSGFLPRFACVAHEPESTRPLLTMDDRDDDLDLQEKRRLSKLWDRCLNRLFDLPAAYFDQDADEYVAPYVARIPAECKKSVVELFEAINTEKDRASGAERAFWAKMDVHFVKILASVHLLHWCMPRTKDELDVESIETGRAIDYINDYEFYAGYYWAKPHMLASMVPSIVRSAIRIFLRTQTEAAEQVVQIHDEVLKEDKEAGRFSFASKKERAFFEAVLRILNVNIKAPPTSATFNVGDMILKIEREKLCKINDRGIRRFLKNELLFISHGRGIYEPRLAEYIVYLNLLSNSS